MTKIGKVFKFETLKGWTEVPGDNRCVLHGPNGEEFIVSASLVQGVGTANELPALRQRLFRNAEQSVKNAAMHPALKVMKPFQRTIANSTMECWTLLAQTQEGEILFYQVVVSDPRGVLVASLEAPNTPVAVDTFNQFIDSVKVVFENEP
jgi:hypothetical protein